MSVMNKALDTLRLDEDGFYLKNLHVERTWQALKRLSPSINCDAIQNVYEEIEAKVLAERNSAPPLIVRIVIDQNLKWTFETKSLIKIKRAVQLQTILSGQACGEGIHNFKWENRTFWQNLLNQKSDLSDDIISVNTENHVTETSRFNLFLYSVADEVVYTPKLSSGCVGGVLRHHLLNQKTISLPDYGLKPLEERDILANDLSGYRIYVGNSVRGILAANLIN